MQAYELTKTGKRVSDSLSAMAVKFVITQTALVVSTVIVVLFEFSFFANLMQNYLWVAIILTQAFLLLIMTFIPTPGSGLGAEGGFYLLFNSVFQQETINMSILFWRLYTFYLPIMVGALFLIPIKERGIKGRSLKSLK